MYFIGYSLFATTFVCYLIISYISKLLFYVYCISIFDFKNFLLFIVCRNTDHIVDKIGILFTIGGFIIWFPLSTIEIFLDLKARFLNERINGYYAVLPFNLAEAIVNTAMASLFGLIFISM
jgi:hypothetical protein